MTHKPIQVGDLIEYKMSKRKDSSLGKAIVVKIDNGNVFHICMLLEDKETETIHPWGGTETPESIERIIDHWEAERVIQALRAGIEQTGLRLWSEEMFNRLRTEMEKSSHKEKL